MFILVHEVTGFIGTQAASASATGEDSKPDVETLIKSTTYDIVLLLHQARVQTYVFDDQI
jgi:nicotinamide riboside kinase